MIRNRVMGKAATMQLSLPRVEDKELIASQLEQHFVNKDGFGWDLSFVIKTMPFQPSN